MNFVGESKIDPVELLTSGVWKRRLKNSRSAASGNYSSCATIGKSCRGWYIQPRCISKLNLKFGLFYFVLMMNLMLMVRQQETPKDFQPIRTCLINPTDLLLGDSA